MELVYTWSVLLVGSGLLIPLTSTSPPPPESRAQVDAASLDPFQLPVRHEKATHILPYRFMPVWEQSAGLLLGAPPLQRSRVASCSFFAASRGLLTHFSVKHLAASSRDLLSLFSVEHSVGWCRISAGRYALMGGVFAGVSLFTVGCCALIGRRSAKAAVPSSGSFDSDESS